MVEADSTAAGTAEAGFTAAVAAVTDDADSPIHHCSTNGCRQFRQPYF
jgi:hypothetical protein